MSKLLFEQETHRILRACLEVYKDKGCILPCGPWFLHFSGLAVDSVPARRQINYIISPVASVAGREAGLLRSASAFGEEASAEWPYGPRPGQESPTLGAKHSTPKRTHPAFVGRRAGDAITGGVVPKRWRNLRREARPI
jgi:hypothetical protein